MMILNKFAEAILDAGKGTTLPNIQNISADQVFTGALYIVYTAAGITAVIVIIIAGYMYVISGGNSAEVEKSKNAILYAVIGLVAVAFAFIVTQFVIGRF